MPSHLSLLRLPIHSGPGKTTMNGNGNGHEMLSMGATLPTEGHLGLDGCGPVGLNCLEARGSCNAGPSNCKLWNSGSQRLIP